MSVVWYIRQYFLLLRAEAFYIAHEQEPKNPEILATLREGLHNVKLLSERTPRSVLEYLRDVHNAFHKGSDVSFNEMLAYVPDIESALILIS